jgi:hypothetical protein
MNLMTTTHAFTGLLCLILSGGIMGSDQPEPPLRFDPDGSLWRPLSYREWIFVGSSLGLRYSKLPNGKSEKQNKPEDQTGEVYHNVYINPYGYKKFKATGEFPDGTVLALELAQAATKNEPGLQGSYQRDFVGLEFSVKDRERFSTGWSYFSFDTPEGMLKDKAQPFPKEQCWDCHHLRAATDHVFTQFYPVLRAK